VSPWPRRPETFQFLQHKLFEVCVDLLDLVIIAPSRPRVVPWFRWAVFVVDEQGSPTAEATDYDAISLRPPK
jgi:hypothetical protein